MPLTQAQVIDWMRKLSRRSKPLTIAGPDPEGKEYFLVVGKDPRLIGEGHEVVVGLNRLQAFNLASQIINGFALEAIKAGSAEWQPGIRTGTDTSPNLKLEN